MLKAETITGAQMKAAGIDAGGDQVAPDQQVVVTRFSPVKKGQSIRLRLSETYTAPQSYRLEGDEFVFERSLGRPRNSVVLPRGWYLTALSIPGGRPPDAGRPDARRLRQRPSGFGGRADEGEEDGQVGQVGRVGSVVTLPLASRHDAFSKPARPVGKHRSSHETDDLPEPGYCTTSVPTMPGWIVQ